MKHDHQEENRTAGDMHPDSDAEHGTVEYFYDTTLGEFALWTGVLGAPVLWAMHHQTNYALVQWACANGQVLVLHLVTAGFLLLALTAGLLSYWNWKRIGARWPVSSDEGIPARTRLLALVGLFTSGMFSLVIFAQGIASFVFNPCEH